jgi:glycerol uptake facilitator-like aquaporin
MDLRRRLLAEYLGSALLAAVVVGSGISAQTLSPGQLGLELLENAAATAAGLFALILMFGAISGAHFNPVVSFVDASFGGISWRTAALYLPAQVAGCISGAVLANLMYAKPAVFLSTHDRATPGHFLSEVVATAGLVLVIFALVRTRRASLAAAAVGAYIGAAYFFTSSTSFANPAITFGRMFSNTFAGVACRPGSVPGRDASRGSRARDASPRHAATPADPSKLDGDGPVRMPSERRPVADERRAFRARYGGPPPSGLSRDHTGRLRSSRGRRGYARARHRPRGSRASAIDP